MSRRFLAQVVQQMRAEVGSMMSATLYGREYEMFRSRLERCFEYNMSDGKFARSALGLDIYKSLCPSATEADLNNAARVCATNELLQTFLLVTDDIMDHASTRRGKPCWYTLPGIGLTAINDGLLLDSAIDVVVRSAIPNHPKISLILRDIYETKKTTIIGQTMDSLMYGFEGVDWDRYKQVVRHKTSHYTYLLPLQLGFHLADRSDYRHIEPLMFKLGYFFQAQDDYLDIFGDNSVTGKTSTDLAEGKCTWLTCTALELMNNEKEPKSAMLEQFKTHFHKSEPESVQKATDILKELSVDKLFMDFEAKEVAELSSEIAALKPVEVRPVLNDALETLIGRKK